MNYITLAEMQILVKTYKTIEFYGRLFDRIWILDFFC